MYDVILFLFIWYYNIHQRIRYATQDKIRTKVDHKNVNQGFKMLLFSESLEYSLYFNQKILPRVDF